MDAAEYSKKQTEIINILTELDRADYITKKEWVNRLVEVSRPIVAKKENLASYINSKLIEYDISYPRTGEYFYSLFEDNEKRGYGTNLISNTVRIHVHDLKVSNDPRLKICECGLIEFEQVVYDIQPIVESKSELSPTEIKDIFDPYDNPMTEYFARVANNCSMLKKIAEDLMFKFVDSEMVEEVIKKKIPHPEIKIVKQKELQAKLMYLLKLTDFRNKIGAFEKLKALLLVETTFLVAKVAKLLAITPKHATNNIVKNKEGYIRDMRWFKQIHLKCKKCNHENEYDIGDWYNEQLIRKQIGLTLEQPFS